jgi:RNA polymerase sigma factor (sigma-70 family)
MQEPIELVNAFRMAVSTSDREDTLTALIERIQPEVHVFLLSKVPIDAVTSITNETLLGIAKGLAGFKGESNGEFWAWSYTIGRKRVAQYFERSRRDETTVPMDPKALSELLEQSGESRPFDDQAEKMDVLFAIEKLRESDPESAEVVWDHYIAGLPYAAIAENCNKSVDAARVQIARAVQKLERLLRRENENASR